MKPLHTTIRFSVIVFITGLLAVLTSCEREDLPEAATGHLELSVAVGETLKSAMTDSNDISTYHLLLTAINSLGETVLDEEIIIQGQFRANCQVVYVEFDDGTYTNEGRAKFRAGHAGWHYAGKVVFLDESEQPYAVVVSRLLPKVELVTGDPALMTPKAKDEVPFR